ncbi:E3 ubiquitin-protein ligase COP1 isoform X2 [Physcomitrium patens]|uniref:RING-type domain-containing protein n=1 Tax=Physcomitrium patens TaxID=3218 RepID=A0A2K1KED3_PHYPA|nr:E3 ubiquitin-protein ligase COP1-like isoform X1 [Physcomitrium patens]XP_024379325.1 E3 ubiquitin-protein ligase COP1-like isoform X1 [Physcomitrium patens]PNR52142.1 hypothetical protein PHYPA_008516 [Physcomitrium patens]|eukprot:XP_024379324.1 E3 ubiquitin-protein ligase COP1-like isoform X1 [Physcomitrella patens]
MASSVGISVSSSLGVLKEEARTVRWASEDHIREPLDVAKVSADVDKDFQCPICLQTIEDAFLTSCGHFFCYSCITTHLDIRSNCPSCARYLTSEQLIPNFLFSKLMKKTAASQLLDSTSSAEQLRLALQQGADLPMKDLNSLLRLIGERKRIHEQEEAECNMEILLDFLHLSHHRKQEEMQEIQGDLQFLKEDIAMVESRRQEILSAKKKFIKRSHLLTYSPPPSLDTHSGYEKLSDGGALSTWRSGLDGASSPPSESKFTAGNMTGSLACPMVTKDGGMKGKLLENPFTESFDGSTGVQTLNKKRRVLAQFEDLQEAYLVRRRQVALNQRCRQMQESGTNSTLKGVKSYQDGLEEFESVLTAFSRYSRLRVVAELHRGDLFHNSNIVSSIEFDRDDEFFATAGVSRRIKIFDFATVINELTDVHCPVVEIPTRSKMSCLSWNKCLKPLIASSDYEGIVTVWDVNTRQSVMEYEEHEKRAWSIDFSRTDPSMLVSGSDDGKMKVWCTRQESSALSLDMKANICCVKYNPGSSNHIAVGSADHQIHYFDLRNVRKPLNVFKGHRKAVSYVKFISPTELASASTDSTLRLWDVQRDSSIRTLRGHTNEKNFVGLTVNNEYIACGSESNEVVVYHKAIPRPAACHGFGSQNPEGSDDDGSHFISAVCWKSEGPTMLAANSQGTVKVLVLAP